MAATSRRSNAAVLRSLSRSGRFYYYRSSSSSSAFASSTSSFSSRSATSFFCRTTSPSRVKLHGSPSVSVSSMRVSLDRAMSPNRSVSVSSSSGGKNRVVQRQSSLKRTCMCSPTTNPGSFRCSLHKGTISQPHAAYSPSRLNARRSAMTNSLVRIGGVDGDLVKRALAALIRPSSHQQRRRVYFKAKSSRLSIMSKAEET